MNNKDFIKKTIATAGAALTIASAGAACSTNQNNNTQTNNGILSEEISSSISDVDIEQIKENSYIVYTDNWYLINEDQLDNYSTAFFSSSISDLEKCFPGFNPSVDNNGNFNTNELISMMPELSTIKYYFLDSTYIDDTGSMNFSNEFSVTKRNPDGTDKYLIANVFPDVVATYETSYKGKDCIPSATIDFMSKYYCYDTPEMSKLSNDVNNYVQDQTFSDNFVSQFKDEEPDEMIFDPNNIDEAEDKINSASYLFDSYKDKEKYYSVNNFVASSSLDGFDNIPTIKQSIAYRYFLLNKNFLTEETKNYLSLKYNFESFDKDVLCSDTEAADDIFTNLCSSKKMRSYYAKSNSQINTYNDCLNAIETYYSIDSDNVDNAEIIKHKLLMNAADFLYRNVDQQEFSNQKIAYHDKNLATICFRPPIYYDSFDKYLLELKSTVALNYKKPDSYVTIVNPDQVVYIYSNDEETSRER